VLLCVCARSCMITTVQTIKSRIGTVGGLHVLFMRRFLPLLCAVTVLAARAENRHWAVTSLVVAGDLPGLKQLYHSDPGVFAVIDADGRTPLHYAVMFCKFPGEIMTFLLNRTGANVNAIDSRGESSLTKAAWQGKEDAVAVLLRHGSNINHRDQWGNTALIISSLKGYVNITKLLLKSGAEMYYKNNHGKTAEEYSEEKSHSQVTEAFLEQRGIDHFFVGRLLTIGLSYTRNGFAFFVRGRVDYTMLATVVAASFISFLLVQHVCNPSIFRRLDVIDGAVPNSSVSCPICRRYNKEDDWRKLYCEVKCVVCTENVKNPLCAPCGHVACKVCCKSWFEQSIAQKRAGLGDQYFYLESSSEASDEEIY
jgi:hypothetical protein